MSLNLISLLISILVEIVFPKIYFILSKETVFSWQGLSIFKCSLFKIVPLARYPFALRPLFVETYYGFSSS